MGKDTYIGKVRKSETGDPNSFMERLCDGKIKVTCYWRNNDDLHDLITEEIAPDDYIERSLEGAVPIF